MIWLIRDTSTRDNPILINEEPAKTQTTYVSLCSFCRFAVLRCCFQYSERFTLRYTSNIYINILYILSTRIKNIKQQQYTSTKLKKFRSFSRKKFILFIHFKNWLCISSYAILCLPMNSMNISRKKFPHLFVSMEYKGISM